MDATLQLLADAFHFAPGAVAVVDALLFGSTTALDPAQAQRLAACEAEQQADPVGWEAAVDAWEEEAFGGSTPVPGEPPQEAVFSNNRSNSSSSTAQTARPDGAYSRK